jgi:hypothetical protein
MVLTNSRILGGPKTIKGITMMINKSDPVSIESYFEFPQETIHLTKDTKKNSIAYLLLKSIQVFGCHIDLLFVDHTFGVPNCFPHVLTHLRELASTKND